MRLKNFAALLILAFVLTVTWNTFAEPNELSYRALENKVQYKNQTIIENITDTDKIHVSTRTGVTSILDSSITQGKEQLLLKVTFKSINLSEYKRELQIMENEKRVFGSELRGKMESDLQNLVQNKWAAVILDNKGKITEHINSPELKEVKLLNLLTIPEQLVIPLPDGDIQIGTQWKEIYAASPVPDEFGQQFTTTIKFTYLGTEEQLGIPCHKFNVSLEFLKEKSPGENEAQITWATHQGSGIMYFAVNGNYLVKSNLASDLSLMILAEDATGKNYVNFVRSIVQQSIEIISTGKTK